MSYGKVHQVSLKRAAWMRETAPAEQGQHVHPPCQGRNSSTPSRRQTCGTRSGPACRCPSSRSWPHAEGQPSAHWRNRTRSRLPGHCWGARGRGGPLGHKWSSGWTSGDHHRSSLSEYSGHSQWTRGFFHGPRETQCAYFERHHGAC